MKVSKNIYRGGLITDINEIQRLALEKKSVVLRLGAQHLVRPAAFILGWPLFMILKADLYYSVRVQDLLDVDFEDLSE